MNTELPRKVIGMPSAEYFDHTDFISRTFACDVVKGGGEVQKWLDSGYSLRTATGAMTLGSNFDALVMGVCAGKSFADLVQVPPPDVLTSNGQRRGKEYDAWKAKAKARGIIDVNAEDAWRLEQMLNHLMENPQARRLVEETTETQVSVFFELNGHRCKVRPDGCADDYWWDLKTTSSPWDRLHFSVGEYGYAEQEWFYGAGAKAIGYGEFRMPFCFVQTMPPFGCRVRYIPQEFVREAGLRMTRVLEEIRLRRETGVYESADADEITEIVMPKWAMKQEEEVVL